MSREAGPETIDYETAAKAIKHQPLRLWLRMFATTTLIEREVRRRLRARFDITLSQFDYLAQLYRSPATGLAMRELSERLMVTNGNITGLTDRLERDGLVVREPSPSDRRVQHVCLTADGRQRFADIANVHEEWIKELMSGLSGEELKQLMTLLAKAKASISAVVGTQLVE